MSAQVEHVPVGHHLGRTDGVVVDVDRHAQFAVDRFGLRGDLEKLIQGSGLVRFQVRPRNVPQPGWVDNLSNRFQS